MELEAKKIWAVLLIQIDFHSTFENGLLRVCIRTLYYFPLAGFVDAFI